jgi:adenosylcobinamide hydrolase
MRYYFNTSTLFICGKFRAAGTGIKGGISSVSTLIIHTVPAGWNPENQEKEFEFIAAREGIDRKVFGLFTEVPVQQCCILQYDYITVFIIAGIRNEFPADTGSIGIIVCSNEGVGDSALLESIMVATEAKAEALTALGFPMSDSLSKDVIVGCEGVVKHRHTGRLTGIGRRIRETVLHGTPEAIRRLDAQDLSGTPSFFIFSRFKGEHWVEVTPHNCQYFPCHFPGQRCDYCYCPFYPCEDENLGQWVKSSNGGKVWNCAKCTLLHEQKIADYFNEFPLSSRAELTCLRNIKKK